MTKIGKVEVVICPMDECRFNDADTCVGQSEIVFVRTKLGRALHCKSFEFKDTCQICEDREWICTKDFKNCHPLRWGMSDCYKACEFHEKCDNCTPDYSSW